MLAHVRSPDPFSLVPTRSLSLSLSHSNVLGTCTWIYASVLVQRKRATRSSSSDSSRTGDDASSRASRSCFSLSVFSFLAVLFCLRLSSGFNKRWIQLNRRSRSLSGSHIRQFCKYRSWEIGEWIGRIFENGVERELLRFSWKCVLSRRLLSAFSLLLHVYRKQIWVNFNLWSSYC